MACERSPSRIKRANASRGPGPTTPVVVLTVIGCVALSQPSNFASRYRIILFARVEVPATIQVPCKGLDVCSTITGRSLYSKHMFHKTLENILSRCHC